jgi:hypothetical protein
MGVRRTLQLHSPQPHANLAACSLHILHHNLRTYTCCITLFFILAAVYYHSQHQSVPYSTMSDSSWHFEAQRGFFSHDNDPETWKFIAVTQPSLGLLGRSYPSDDEYWAKQGGSPGDPAHSKWPRFQHYLTYLNAKNPGQEKYKMLYIVRHGQGVHNVVKEEVGRDEWNVCPAHHRQLNRSLIRLAILGKSLR